MGKGSVRRPEATPGAYASGYERTFGGAGTCERCGGPLKPVSTPSFERRYGFGMVMCDACDRAVAPAWQPAAQGAE